jgi:hypothetical protein
MEPVESHAEQIFDLRIVIGLPKRLYFTKDPESWTDRSVPA